MSSKEGALRSRAEQLKSSASRGVTDRGGGGGLHGVPEVVELLLGQVSLQLHARPAPDVLARLALPQRLQPRADPLLLEVVDGAPQLQRNRTRQPVSIAVSHQLRGTIQGQRMSFPIIPLGRMHTVSCCRMPSHKLKPRMMKP